MITPDSYLIDNHIVFTIYFDANIVPIQKQVFDH